MTGSGIDGVEDALAVSKEYCAVRDRGRGEDSAAGLVFPDCAPDPSREIRDCEQSQGQDGRKHARNRSLNLHSQFPLTMHRAARRLSSLRGIVWPEAVLNASGTARECTPLLPIAVERAF
jgi:hypothetical protein